MAAIDAIFTVYDALVACGVDDVAIFMNQTPAMRLAEDIFDDMFETCRDLTFKELDEHFKTYSDLTVQQGQIRVRPGVRKNIKAFVQWACDEFRLGRDPGTVAFPINQVSDLIRRYKTHEKYQADSKTLAEAAKPDLHAAEISASIELYFLSKHAAESEIVCSGSAVTRLKTLCCSSASMLSIYARQTKLSSRYFMPERNHHICGGLSSRSALPVRSTHMSNVSKASSTQIQ
jgi:hypothetical protein